MQLKLVAAKIFFEAPSNLEMKELSRCQRLLEAFFSETPEGPFDRKITLTDSYLIISSTQRDSFAPILFLNISDELRFQKINNTPDPKYKTPDQYAIALINQKSEAFRFFLQFSCLAELWQTRLADHLTQLGFHEHYRVLDRIGKGSTSVVYKVQRNSDGKIFAAKAFLKSFLASKPQRRCSVFNEISLLRAMQHPNILKIYGVYQSGSALYIVTELLEGGTLIERVNQLRGFKLPQVKKVMKSLISGLAYMHRFSIMHRDIKLQNIMFRSKNTMDVVIVDFGLAAISQDQPYNFYRCGTPGYIAPQIISLQSKEKIEVICDVFSAGVILHILLTNRYVFTGTNNQQIYQKNKSLMFDLQDQFYQSFDQQAIDLLSQMLQIDPQQRISAEDILCQPFLSGQQLQEDLRLKEIISPAVTTFGQEHYLL